MDINKYIIEKLVTKPDDDDCGWWVYDLIINNANITSNINEGRRYIYLCQHAGEHTLKRKAMIFASKDEESSITLKVHCTH